jgi:diguanylate cyclase (GGDEF)-like protein/PAS domain S-box-containing protein
MCAGTAHFVLTPLGACAHAAAAALLRELQARCSAQARLPEPGCAWSAARTGRMHLSAAAQELRELPALQTALLTADPHTTIAVPLALGAHHYGVWAFTMSAQALATPGAAARIDALLQLSGTLALLLRQDLLQRRVDALHAHTQALELRCRTQADASLPSAHPHAPAPGSAPAAAAPHLDEAANGTNERAHPDGALRDSSSRLLEAQRLARIGDWELLPNSQTYLLSDTACEILGITDGPEISRHDYHAMIHPLDKEAMARRRAALQPGETGRAEFRMIRRDGVVIYLESTATLVPATDTAPLRYFGVLQDITGRRIAAQALHLALQAIESSSDGIVIADTLQPDLPIIYTNPAFLSITGYGRDEVIGRNCRFLQNGEPHQIGLDEIRGALRDGRAGQAVVRNFRRDGTPFWNNLKVTPVRNELGAVTHYVGVLCDVTERVHFEAELALRASHDVLTRLPNRYLLEERVAEAIEAAQHSGERVTVAFVDLDHFKFFNDSMGHAGGDTILRTVGERISSCLGFNDTVARFGGDEFVMLLRDIYSVEDITKRLADVLHMLALPMPVAGREILVGASIGAASYPADGASSAELISHADFAMYRAKAEGRGVFRLYDPASDQHNALRLELERDLCVALEQQQFELHYQPRVDAQTGAICGSEALIRWQHAQRGMIAPLDFIPIAEQTGLIGPIGAWVLRAACTQNQAWVEQGLMAVPVSVNVSMAQFRHPDFPAMVREVLRDTGMAAHLLELELTESVVMHNPQGCIAMLGELKAMGVQLAIDDFGTGYSSLSYLKRFPIDHLKIDRAFVRDIMTDEADATICRTVIAMAHSLGIRVVAEGVETLEQAAFLRLHGCEELQGYLICRPQPAPVLAARLGSGVGLLPQ